MTDCAGIATCPFFNDRMQNMPFIADMMKKHYCRDDFEHCARYMVKQRLGKDRVPGDLFPNQSTKAERLISAGEIV